MTEDLDKDLEGLAGDLDDLDLGDLGGGGDDPAAAAGDDLDLGELGDIGGGGEPAADAGGGDDLDLGELGEMAGGGDEPAADAGGGGGDNVELDDDLQAMLGDTGGGGGGGGESAPAAAAPPARAAPRPPPPSASLSGDQAVNLEFLLDIKLHVTFEVGRSKMLISDLLTLGQGSVVELHRLVGEELDLLVNGKLIAKGEVVVDNEKFGCKVSEIVSPEERVKHLGAV
jgi:flagellar motor switch protein FliN/FliY